mmetsp:Transcript_27873/g.42202  ORF Transcript_27873/g.42202 Transcript_27873/m.42202 type:complete len:327 (+) Transcript_27873:53-1033(+)
MFCCIFVTVLRSMVAKDNNDGGVSSISNDVESRISKLLQRPQMEFLLRFHALFFGIAMIVLLPCLFSLLSPKSNQDITEACNSMGNRVSFLVLGWNAAYVMFTSNDFPDLFHQWKFSCILSALMVIPDFFLADVLGALHFPDDGAVKIGGVVSWYMSAMWTIPFVLILATTLNWNEERKKECIATRRRGSVVSSPALDNKQSSELLVASYVALVIFGLAEYLLFPLNLWHATDLVYFKIGPAAIYVLPAEALLGSALVYGYQQVTKKSSIPTLLMVCWVIMLLYTGALAVSFLVIEQRLAKLQSDTSSSLWLFCAGANRDQILSTK